MSQPMTKKEIDLYKIFSDFIETLDEGAMLYFRNVCNLRREEGKLPKIMSISK